jgi:hypothetical protein
MGVFDISGEPVFLYCAGETKPGGMKSKDNE